MSQDTIHVILAGFAAALSVFMWVDYFRRIDVFESEHWLPLFLALCVGGFTPYLSLFVYDLFSQAGFAENGKFFNDLLFSIFGIGLNEELSKLAGVLVVFRLFRKYINDPIDLLIYAGVTALGFSLVENFYYFSNYGIRIISSRAFYSALEHIINTTIIVYGFYRAEVFHKGRRLTNTLIAFVLAVASHGLFDFFLIQPFLGRLTSYFSLLVYLFGINFWVQMLNNANNFSNYFDYQKIVFSARLANRLFLWYFATLAVVFVNNYSYVGLEFSIKTLFKGLLSHGLLFWIVIMRISRFKIFKQKYFQVSLALPFYITPNKDEDFKIPILNLPVKIRGENQQEYFLTRYLGKNVRLYPLENAGDTDHSKINGYLDAVVTDKLLLYDDVIVYSIFISDADWIKPNKIFVLKPVIKTFKRLEVEGLVLALYGIEIGGPHLEFNELTINQLDFISWIKLPVQPVLTE